MSRTVYSVKKELRSEGSKKFSILIPTWNNLPYLQLCIESIRKNSVYDHQIIVHINEGKDGTLQWIKSQPHIDYTSSDINIGICYALNYCRTIATTDYILYMNDDMYVCPGWDQSLAEEIDKRTDPFFFFSSTMIEPTFTSNSSVIVKDYGDDLVTFNEKKLLEEYKGLDKTDWMGATWPPNIVHKDIWDLVGGYSTEFSPGFYSDPDFSMKLWQAGVRTFKGIGDSRVYHFGSKSTGRIDKKPGYYKFINKWGLTSAWFTRNILLRGKTYTGDLTEVQLHGMEKLKMRVKRWIASGK